jgi:hypothetical protein
MIFAGVQSKNCMIRKVGCSRFYSISLPNSADHVRPCPQNVPAPARLRVRFMGKSATRRTKVREKKPAFSGI